MKNKVDILIFGNGNIGRAIFYYLNKFEATGRVAFFHSEKRIKDYNLLIGALPGENGEKGLEMALKYRKDLIDVSDIEPEFYLKHKEEIRNEGIRVVPGCGFCPGLVNLILGREMSLYRDIEEVEVKVGTLSLRRFFFPFLWCFEDLILEHQISSQQMINGKIITMPPFSGYQEDEFYGIKSETYFAASGFENLIAQSKIKNFVFRVIRPLGFSYFYRFLDGYGFLSKENIQITKNVLVSRNEDNLSLADLRIKTKGKNIVWKIKSFSQKQELFNSMQKVTSLTVIAVINLFLDGLINDKGLLFMEDIGGKGDLFEKAMLIIKKSISCSRSEQ